MVNRYSSYRCRTCGKSFVLLNEDVKKQEKLNRYLVCPYCSSKRISREKVSDNIKECMDARHYKRINGAIRQIER